jgi:hypothetical protein
MAERLAWWAIPGAMLVMLRVATLEPRRSGESVPTGVAPAASASLAAGVAQPSFVQLRDASGARLDVLLNPAAERVLRLRLPSEHIGERAALTLWRRVDGGREPQSWLQFTTTLRNDATVPIVGLPSSLYDVEATVGGRTFVARGAAMPDVVELAPSH